MSSFKRLADAGDLTGKTALVRVDFNVPMENGLVTDDTRLRAAIDTVQTLRTQGAKVALLAHFGRPKGERVADMSLAPIAGAFAKVLGSNVSFIADCKGEHVKQAIADLDPAGVILLENTRFYAGEEKGDPELAKEIAALGDIYVNDAFSAAHRKHVSTAVLATLLPAYAGVNMEAELDALDKALGTPERPVLAVVGGAKVSSKIDLLKNLVTQVDSLAIGGGMANTFLLANGVGVGRSLAEPDLVDAAVVFASVSSRFVDNLRQFTEPNRPDGARAFYDEHGTPAESPRFYRDLSSRTFFDRVEVPVMLHHGTSDDVCPPVWSRQTDRLLREAGARSTLVEWPGEQHAFGPRFADSLRRTVAFLRRHLDV